jgi:hypothetical protein
VSSSQHVLLSLETDWRGAAPSRQSMHQGRAAGTTAGDVVRAAGELWPEPVPEQPPEPAPELTAAGEAVAPGQGAARAHVGASTVNRRSRVHGELEEPRTQRTKGAAYTANWRSRIHGEEAARRCDRRRSSRATHY